jgi:hypothetical protein
MPSRLEALHAEARELFLGKGAVVGIGIAEETGDGTIEFLLSDNRPQTRKLVEAWAAGKDVSVGFLMTGPIKIGSPR